MVEYEELEESVDNKTTIDKSLEILDQIVVEEDKINESETEIARLKREMDQLRKMINETARVASAQGGGGEVRFQYLDDIVGIASNLSSFDGMYLGIDASNSAQPFKFSSVSSNTGAGGTWATFDSNTGVTTTKKVKINNDLEVTGVTTSTGGFVGSLTGSASSLSGVSSSFLLDYDNFTNTPTIPTNNNQLSNGAGYITTSFTNTNQLTNGAGFVTFTNNNQLTNGAGYITTSFTNTNQLTNGAGFITNNVSGTLTATSFIGNGSALTGIVTTLVAGDNINLSGSTGSVTITGLASTDRINAESIVVSGVATFSSNVTIGGTLTYEDVTNIDSVGLITARNGINITGGGINVVGVSTLQDLNITGNITSNVTIISTDTGSSAAPEFKLYRNSASPANADYLGQIKFAGESDTGVERNYAKITGKISDASNGTEDGIIEIAHIKAGSQNISARFKSTELMLMNGTKLSVDGTSTFTGNILANSDSTVDIGTNSTRFANVYADTFHGAGTSLTGVSTNFVSAVGIQSGGTTIGAGITQLNFIGTGNTSDDRDWET